VIEASIFKKWGFMTEIELGISWGFMTEIELGISCHTHKKRSIWDM